jgi:hypothetical protein
MSSVRKKDQSEHRFTTLDIILDMYDHTATVIANPKFDKCPIVRDRIENEAAMIYHLCRTANEDHDNRSAIEARIRLKLEYEAIEKCYALKTNIRLAQKLLHLRAKKVIYWVGLVNKALNAIKNWRAAEYRNYVGGKAGAVG